MRRRPARRLAAVDLRGLGFEEGAIEKALGRRRQAGGIGDDAVAHAKRPLGRLDQPVDVLEAFRLRDAKALEQRQDDERGEPLRRRRRVVERARLERHAQRLGHGCAILREVGPRHRAVDALEIGRDLAPDIAAIEIVETRTGEMIEGGGERALPERAAGLRRLAVDQEGLREARHILELAKLLGGQPRLAPGDHVTIARMADGVAEQRVERHASALRARGFERERPAADGARHRERGERAARRHRLMLAVELAPRVRAGAAGRRQRPHAAAPLAKEPKTVAADVVHVRIDRRDGRRHRDHGFERVAALRQHGAAGLGGRVVGSGRDAAAMSGAVEVHGSGRRRV